jgi:hypothetical protein
MKIPFIFPLNLISHLNKIGYKFIHGFNENTIEAYKNGELWLLQLEPIKYQFQFYTSESGFKFIEFTEFKNQLNIYAQVHDKFKYVRFYQGQIVLLSPKELYKYYLKKNEVTNNYFKFN